MIVTKIEPVTKTKYKVFLDDEFAFVLYKGELSHFQIKEESELEQVVFEKIKTEIVLKRAKLRAMHLLNDMDRTEVQLRMKLKQGLYPEDIVEQAVQYVKSFGYIGDSDYARRFIQSRQGTKSQKEIYAALSQKGIDRKLIENAMEKYYESADEQEAIRKILAKKRFAAEEATDAEKNKIFNYLVRKGFSYNNIRQVIQVSAWNA